MKDCPLARQSFINYLAFLALDTAFMILAARPPQIMSIPTTIIVIALIDIIEIPPYQLVL